MRRVVARVRSASRNTRQRVRLGRMYRYVALGAQTPGWSTPGEAAELARACHSLRGDATLVEVGAFLGRSTIVLAGSRQVRGQGVAHVVDPFDGRGDAFSAPVYSAIIGELDEPVRTHFDRTIREAGVADRLVVHQGTAESVVRTWSTPIDLLLLDADHSPAEARSVFLLWEPWLRIGGTIVLPNSAPREFALDHDGQFLVAGEFVIAPWYEQRRVVDNWTFATKVSARPGDL